jgi:predicted RNA-binding Zn-ribbon protein involved in translation (DUF1610 family)
VEAVDTASEVTFMEECPYCGSDLIGAAGVRKERGGDPLGSKTTGSALVSCPDCGEVIDGFKAH